MLPAQELVLALEVEKKVSAQARQEAEQDRQRAEKAEAELQRLKEQLGLKDP